MQFAQPIVGIAASGLSFLFPYLSGRMSALPTAELKGTVFKAFACNVLMVCSCSAGLLIFGPHLIQLWAGVAVARTASELLPAIVLGSALAGLGTTGVYAMQAMGQFRTVALISISGRLGMLLVMAFLLHQMGVQGLANSRLCYGLVPMFVYVPLLRQLQGRDRVRRGDQPLPAECRGGVAQ